MLMSYLLWSFRFYNHVWQTRMWASLCHGNGFIIHPCDPVRCWMLLTQQMQFVYRFPASTSLTSLPLLITRILSQPQKKIVLNQYFKLPQEQHSLACRRNTTTIFSQQNVDFFIWRKKEKKNIFSCNKVQKIHLSLPQDHRSKRVCSKLLKFMKDCNHNLHALY